MRHRVKGRKLGRTASHRLATMRAIATALFKHKKIKTTLAKAKEARTFVEPMITRAKQNSVHAKRLIFKDIKDREVMNELFGDIIEKIGERKGGYTRIVKLGQRQGDAAQMAILELVDYNDMSAKKPAPKAEAKEEKAEEVKSEEPKAEKKTSAKSKAAKKVTADKPAESEKEEKAPKAEKPKTEKKAAAKKTDEKKESDKKEAPKAAAKKAPKAAEKKEDSKKSKEDK